METLIRKLESFGPLPEEDKKALRALAIRERRLEAHVDIFAEGDAPNDVHLITSGLACRYKIIDGGKRQIVAYLLPGDFCDLHVFILKEMDHSMATISPCTVVDISRNTILELLDRPMIARALLMATLVDEATLREWITNIGHRRAEERIAHLFCELHVRFKAVGLAHDGSIMLPVTQNELADTVGLSTVHINRSLQSLREADLITMKSGFLHIPDVCRLEQMCGFRSNYLHLSNEGAKGVVAEPLTLATLVRSHAKRIYRRP